MQMDSLPVKVIYFEPLTHHCESKAMLVSLDETSLFSIIDKEVLEHLFTTEELATVTDGANPRISWVGRCTGQLGAIRLTIRIGGDMYFEEAFYSTEEKGMCEETFYIVDSDIRHPIILGIIDASQSYGALRSPHLPP